MGHFKSQLNMKYVLIILFILLSITVVNAQNQPDFLHNESYKSGINFFNKKDYSRAIKYFEKAIKEDNRNQPAYAMIGVCYLETGDLIKAKTYIDTSLKLDTNDVEMYVVKAVCEFHLENFDLAIHSATKAIELGTEDYNAFYFRGLSYNKKGSQFLALSDFKAAVAAGTSNVDVFLLGGVTAFEIEEYDDALRFFEVVIKHDENIVDAFLYRGRIYFIESYFEHAIQDFLTYTASLKNSEQQRSEKLFTQTKPEIIQSLGISYVYTGDFDKAIKYLNESLQFESSRLNSSSIYYSKSHFFLAIIYFNLEDLEKVKLHLKAMIEIVPEEGAPYLQLAKLYHNEEDYDTALSYLKQIGNKTTDLTDRKEYLNDIAKLHIQYEEIDKAIHYHLEYLKLNPDNKGIKQELEEVFFRNMPKYIDQHLMYYDILASKYDTKSKEYAYFQAVKSMLFLEIKDWDNAIEDIGRAIEIHSFSEYYSIRSLVHFMKYTELMNQEGEEEHLIKLKNQILKDIDKSIESKHRKADAYILKTIYLMYFEMRDEACKTAKEAIKFGATINKNRIKSICTGKEPMKKNSEWELNYNLSSWGERFSE